MARKEGSLKLSSNIEPRASAPLDARTIVPTLADLTASGAFPYPYVGMIVSVKSEGKAYMLTADDTTVSTNWKEIGSGEGTLWADSPIGTILPYGGLSAPTGWLTCNGIAISRTDYADLFNAIGTSFGSGDGSTTFNIPDLRESTTKGIGENPNGASHVKTGGLALGEFIDDRVQEHTHLYKPSTTPGQNGTGVPVLVGSSNAASGNNSGRSGDTTEVKAVGVNYIIKAKQVAVPADFMDAVEDAVVEFTPRVWSGSYTDWDALPLEEKIRYDEAHLTGDSSDGGIADVVEENNMNAVTSNAVYNKFEATKPLVTYKNISLNTNTVPNIAAISGQGLRAIRMGNVLMLNYYLKVTSWSSAINSKAFFDLSSLNSLLNTGESIMDESKLPQVGSLLLKDQSGSTSGTISMNGLNVITIPANRMCNIIGQIILAIKHS